MEEIMMRRSSVFSVILLAVMFTGLWAAAAEPEPADMLTFNARSRVESPAGSGKYEAVIKRVQWDPKKTAIVVIDMGKKHWCRGAERRAAEMAPQMNEFIKAARRKGVMIV
ncbi:hypothetical protein LCGC14_2033480, partial [marine sediment metagenome]